MSDSDDAARCDPLAGELSRLEARLAEAPSARTSVIDELSRVREDLSRRGSAPFRLDELRIASPCKERWADMLGDERVRVCNGCERPVFDLSKLTRAEAEAVLATRGVAPCVRLRRRADGTVITADCAPPRRRLAAVAGALAASAALLGASPAGADPLPVEVSAQVSGGIQGVVKDAATGEALIGASVIVTGAPQTAAKGAITDENGFYRLTELPPGDYTVTIYYGATTDAHRDVQVTAGAETVMNAELAIEGDETIVVEGHAPIVDMGSTTQGITLDRDFLTHGIPVGSTFGDVLGAAAGTTILPEPAAPPPAPPPPPPRRPRIEWSSWLRLGFTIEHDAPAAVARVIGPPPDDRRAGWEAALGADVSFPLARHGDLRLGAWAEARTSSGPVLGVELLDEDDGHVFALRAGADLHVVTAAIAYGYLHGARLVLSANRALDAPDDRSATAGLELDPVHALRYLLARWY